MKENTNLTFHSLQNIILSTLSLSLSTEMATVSQPPFLNPTRSRTRIVCKKPANNSSSAFQEKKQVSVDYDRGTHHISTRIPGLTKQHIPKHHRLRVETERFQKEWAVSDVVDRVYKLRHWDDIEGLLNRWVGRFARKNFPVLIKVKFRFVSFHF